MKTDVNGASTCPIGEERYEFFDASWVSGDEKQRVQYDYRHESGELFSCVAKTLEDARKVRDAWLAGRLSGEKPVPLEEKFLGRDKIRTHRKCDENSCESDEEIKLAYRDGDNDYYCRDHAGKEILTGILEYDMRPRRESADTIIMEKGR